MLRERRGAQGGKCSLVTCNYLMVAALLPARVVVVVVGTADASHLSGVGGRNNDAKRSREERRGE